jgi:hypothetical protein
MRLKNSGSRVRTKVCLSLLKFNLLLFQEHFTVEAADHSYDDLEKREKC